jgi:hypothetical protein
VDEEELRARLARWCREPAWVAAVALARPYGSARDLLAAAERAANQLDAGAWHAAESPNVATREGATSMENVESNATHRATTVRRRIERLFEPTPADFDTAGP